MRTFVLLLCLLFALSCVKLAAPPPPVVAAPPVLPQFERLNALHEDFLGFRADPLFVRYGFTFNSPHADWLQQVQRLEREPDLAEGSRVLAGLAVAHRQYGAGSVVTRRYETRFARIVRNLPDEPSVPEGTDPAVDTAGAAEPPAGVAEVPVPVDGSPVAEAEAPVTLDDVIASVVQPAVPLAGPDGPATEPPAVSADTPVAEAETQASSGQAVAAASSESAVEGASDVVSAPVLAVETPASISESSTAEAQAVTVVSPDVVADSTESESASEASDAAGDGFAQSAMPSVAASSPVSDTSGVESEPAAPVAEEGSAQPAVASSAQVSDTSSLESASSAPAAEDGSVQPAQPVVLPVPVSDAPAEEGAPAAAVVESAGAADDAAAPGQSPAIVAEAPAPAVQALPAVSSVAEGARPGVTVLFSGDTQGVIFPQPGVAGPVGGLARRPPLIGRVRVEEPGVVLVDAGDAFTSGFGRARRINNVLVRAMNRMGYDAMGLGPYDLALGEVALRELVSIAEFPFVCTNLVFQEGVKPWIKPYVILRRGPFRIGVISLLPPDAGVAVTGARVVPPGHALRGVLAELGSKVDGVVLLTQMGSSEVAEILNGLAVAVVAGDGKAPSREVPLYLPALPKGLGFGRVRLEPAEGGALRPAEHGPVLFGEQQDGQMLRLMEELRN